MSRYPYIGYFEDYDYYGEEHFNKEFFSKEDIQKLEEIYKNNTFNDIKVVSTYEDDHEICVNVIIDGVKCSFLWIIFEFAADVSYAEKGDEKAKQSVMEYIKDCMRPYMERK